VISVRTLAPNISLQILRDVNGTWESFKNETGLTPEILTQSVKYSLSGLPADTAITVFAIAGNDTTSVSRPARFRTAPRMFDPPRIVKFGATSSFGRANAPWRSLSKAAEEKYETLYGLAFAKTRLILLLVSISSCCLAILPTLELIPY